MEKIPGGVICQIAVLLATTYAMILPAITMTKTECDIPEHTHTEACYAQVTTANSQEELAENGQPAETQVLICGIEEHTHTEECSTSVEPTEEERAAVEFEGERAAVDTKEESSAVDEVTALIDALPTYEELSENLAAFEEAMDEDGYEAYLTEISA